MVKVEIELETLNEYIEKAEKYEETARLSQQYRNWWQGAEAIVEIKKREIKEKEEENESLKKQLENIPNIEEIQDISFRNSKLFNKNLIIREESQYHALGKYLNKYFPKYCTMYPNEMLVSYLKDNKMIVVYLEPDLLSWDMLDDISLGYSLNCNFEFIEKYWNIIQ